MQKSLIAIVVTGFFTLAAWAAEPIAKEETIPPPPEGPFTADQIPPYNSMPLANKPLQQLKPNSSGEIPTPANPAAPAATNPEQLAPGQPPANQPQFAPQAPPSQQSFAPPQEPAAQQSFALPNQPQTPSTQQQQPSANPQQFAPSNSGPIIPASPNNPNPMQ